MLLDFCFQTLPQRTAAERLSDDKVHRNADFGGCAAAYRTRQQP